MSNSSARKKYQQNWHEATCEACGSTFVRARTNKTTCSASCKSSLNNRSVSTCRVEGCSKPANRVGPILCEGHYMKQRRYGTTEPSHPSRRKDLTGIRFGTLTVIRRDGEQWVCSCDCGRMRTTYRWNLESQGDANACGDYVSHHRSETPGYYAVHSRLCDDRGRAATYDCVDCGGPAAQWSYNHTDPNELVEMIGKALAPYSVDQSHYSPRCVSCHKTFDLAHLMNAG